MASKSGKKNLVPLSSDSAAMYEAHRKRYDQGWGLAWYLASELCDRFHASHGLVFESLIHDGLGFYGIGVRPMPCKANNYQQLPALGRLTISGDVENWSTGEPGDHGLPLFERAMAGEAPDSLVRAAVAHLRLPPRPAQSHLACRHKRRGASYGLVFQLATMVALRYNIDGGVGICNDPWEFDQLLREHDPKFEKPDFPGAVGFFYYGRKVLVSGDGRVLLSPEPSPSLWERYMSGESTVSLARWVLDQLEAQ